jgi:hypothetical protein
MRPGTVLSILAGTACAACNGGGPAAPVPALPSAGFELTPLEMMAGVTAADVAVAVYPPLDPRG